jgi:transcriptional/translational regulatory protein YebC/TACO1
MFARWDKMSKAFARIGKELTIAVKAGGPTPSRTSRCAASC